MEQIDIISTFQNELHRLLTPIEKEIIEDWKKEGFDDQTIFKGLKQAVFSNIVTFRYINKILQSWKHPNEAAPINANASENDMAWLYS